MLTVGLTGGIGSGKSAVTALLAKRGATVVDADLIARDVVAPATAGLAAVAEAFGPTVLRTDGSLDRAALGARVFADPGELARLNAIVHPLVGAETTRRVEQAREQGAQVVVLDVPLLVENGLQDLYDVVVVVAADPQVQLSRLTEQRGMSEADARARIEAQAPLAAKLAVATHVVDNNGSRAALVRQVERLWSVLAEAARTRPDDPVSPSTGTGSG